jgi:hypothetical protein
MKNDFNSQFYDDKDFFASVNEGESTGSELNHENEIGVAIHEDPQAASKKDDLFGERDDDEFLFSSKKDDDLEDEEEEEDRHTEEGGEKPDLAYAESSKDRLVDKIKSNLIYVFIALILIVPGAFKLYDVLFGPGETQPTQTAQNLSFAETKEKPATITAGEKNKPATVAAVEPKATEPKEENAVRSVFNKITSLGSGSEQTSANMPIDEGKLKPAEGAQKPEEKQQVSGTAASILETNKNEGGSEQILDRYFAQESKVEDQLTELLGKMDDIEARLATVDDINTRLTALEKNNNAETLPNEQLQQLVKRIGQLEQNMNQLRQQTRKAPTAAAPAASSANQQGTNTGVSSGVSVEAVIPGRAWLRTRDGVLMVVEVGDEIPGVGKVTRIDAREGVVATTTQIFKQ